MIGLVRKIFAQLKSDLTPTQLAVGAFLGALGGLTPFGFHFLLLFLLALLFNCSMASFLLVAAALKPLGFAFAGTSFSLGTSLLRGGGVYADLVAWASGAPFLAYLGFDRYVVAGGYALATPLAVVLAVFVRIGVEQYRKAFAPKLADATWFQAAMKKWWFRAFKWVLTGKDKELKEAKPRFVLFRPFRPYMLAFIPLLAVGLSVGGGLYAQAAVQGLATKALSEQLGVNCTFGKIDYSFFGQSLAFQNFQMPDPADTKKDLVRIGAFEADLGFVSLLSKRLHVEKLAVKDVTTRVARDSDGKLNVSKLKTAPPEGRSPAWEEWLTWVTTKGKEVDWAEWWKKYQDYRKKAKAEEEVAREKAKTEKPQPLAYDASLRWEPPRAEPLVRVDLVEAAGLALAVEDPTSPLPGLTSVSARLESLSTKPGWDGKPTTATGKGVLGANSGTIAFKASYLPGDAKLEFSLDGAPLVDWRALYEKSLPVKVEAGTASLGTTTGAAGGRIDGRFDLKLEKLKIAAKPGETKILGLDAETSAYAIQGINAYGEKFPVAVAAGISGPLEDPSIDAKLPFLEIAKKGLEQLGKAELQKYVDKLGGEADKLKKLGAEKLAPVTGGAEKTLEAIKAGDAKAAEEAARKAAEDAKKLKDAPKDAKKQVEDAKKNLDDLKDLFKKKK
jgi:uncharacterized protein (TIGR03546 family)